MNSEPLSSGAAASSLCPSAQPEMAGVVAFGVVQGTPEQPHLVQIEKPVAVTADLLQLAGPVKPTQVFRFAAPCAGGACKHFDGRDCALVQRVVQILPAVSEDIPRCTIRADCQWWRQEGKAACLRCPQVVTEACNYSDDYARAADS
jgi:hypothetical protein